MQVSHYAVQRVQQSVNTIHVVCTDLLRVVCIGLLSAELSTVNTGLGRPMFWKPLSLAYSLWSGCHKLSTYIDYLHFQLKSSTFSRKAQSEARQSLCHRKKLLLLDSTKVRMPDEAVGKMMPRVDKS